MLISSYQHYLWADKNACVHITIPYTSPLMDSNCTWFVSPKINKIGYSLYSSIRLDTLCIALVYKFLISFISTYIDYKHLCKLHHDMGELSMERVAKTDLICSKSLCSWNIQHPLCFGIYWEWQNTHGLLLNAVASILFFFFFFTITI